MTSAIFFLPKKQTCQRFQISFHSKNRNRSHCGQIDVWPSYREKFYFIISARWFRLLDDPSSVDRVGSYSVPLWWSKVQIPINSTCSIINLSNVIFLVNNQRNTVWVKLLCILPLFYLIELTRSWPMRVGTLFKLLGHCDQNCRSFKIFPKNLRAFFSGNTEPDKRFQSRMKSYFLRFWVCRYFFLSEPSQPKTGFGERKRIFEFPVKGWKRGRCVSRRAKSFLGMSINASLTWFR